jgi:signal transduction histidine kinase
VGAVESTAAAPAALIGGSAAERRLYQEIVDNARAATGALFVNFAWFDPATMLVHVGANAGEPRVIRAGVEAIRRLIPGWDPADVVLPADANPCTARVFFGRETIDEPFEEVVRGTVPGWLARIAGTVVGMRRTYSCPVMLQDAVVGSLSFHTPAALSASERSVCDAFARQAALAIENARLLRLLREQVEEVGVSRRLISAAQDRQRREVAELLHGRVQTRLLLVWHQLGQVGGRWPDAPPELLALVEAARHDLDRVREEEVRRASHLLHPSVIQIGLQPAIRSLARAIESQLEVEVVTDAALQAADDPGENRIPEAARLTAYRVIEEALANVVRHAGVARARVELGVDGEGRLQVGVRDEGRGFEPGRRSDGLGMRAVAGRVADAGGEWGVVSAPGEGTRVWCRLPLAGAPLEPAS